MTAAGNSLLTLAATKDVAYGPLVLALLANTMKPNSINIRITDQSDQACILISNLGLKFTKPTGVMRYICRLYITDLYETHFGLPLPDKSTTIDNFMSEILPKSNMDELHVRLAHINDFLALRSYMVGYNISLADYYFWSQLKSIPMFMTQILKSGAYVNVTRWFYTIDHQPCVQLAISMLNDSVHGLNKQKKDQGSFEIDLPNAQSGAVVTRFPPEPSGYLHIGHAKAALLNQYFANKYNGKLIVRFDDTNPSKEKVEFVDSILHDLELLGIKPDSITYTSDHFDSLLEYCDVLIRQGDAFVDNTDSDTMRDQRMHGIASKNRDLSVSENLKLWMEMKNGSTDGYCVRAKISVDDNNKAMRDPVIFRSNTTPHHRTGTKYKVYPTYDLACPVVDSVEGVTHALRTNEYRDRNPQYSWFLQKLNLRTVHVWDFSRLNFVYTLLSKRKLQWFVDNGHVSGWDDPRFPTVRGILRRGMTVEALRQYILMQGASTNTTLLEWDKFWTLNKKVIDPVAPRHVALAEHHLVPVHLVDGPSPVAFKQVPKHKKNPDVGVKTTGYFRHILLEGHELDDVVDGEEVTLMDWGNVVLTKINRGPAGVSVEGTMNLGGDVKSTRKKLTWLVDAAKVQHGEEVTVPVTLYDYDYLITKKKLEADDEFSSVLTPKTEFVTHAVGDANLKHLHRGDIIQLERRGYYICDANTDAGMHLIFVPDGKLASVASKHALGHVASGSVSSNKVTGLVASQQAPASVPGGTCDAPPTMYRVRNLFQDMDAPFDESELNLIYRIHCIS